MKKLSKIPAYIWRLLFAAALLAAVLMTEARAFDGLVTTQPDSWIFARSQFSHDPDTGARVAQYARKPPVEPLPDPRAVTSVYSRSRTVLRGADGSSNTYYRTRNYGNGRGGIDAEWERFHDAWRGSRVAGGSYAAGGSYQATPPYGFGQGYGYGGGFGGFFPGQGPVGHGHTSHDFGRRVAPGAGYGPGYGRPDAGYLDPDATDGYRDPSSRTPDHEFFNREIDHRIEHHLD